MNTEITDNLPEIGTKARVFLARINAWVIHTITGYYSNSETKQVFAKLIDNLGLPHACEVSQLRLDKK